MNAPVEQGRLESQGRGPQWLRRIRYNWEHRNDPDTRPPLYRSTFVDMWPQYPGKRLPKNLRYDDSAN